MRKSNHETIRSLLRKETDGLLIADIADATGIRYDSIYGALKAMPDAYIDRWSDRKQGKPAAVWCVVVPPADCPKPDRKQA